MVFSESKEDIIAILIITKEQNENDGSGFFKYMDSKKDLLVDIINSSGIVTDAANRIPYQGSDWHRPAPYIDTSSSRLLSVDNRLNASNGAWDNDSSDTNVDGKSEWYRLYNKSIQNYLNMGYQRIVPDIESYKNAYDWITVSKNSKDFFGINHTSPYLCYYRLLYMTKNGFINKYCNTLYDYNNNTFCKLYIDTPKYKIKLDNICSDLDVNDVNLFGDICAGVLRSTERDNAVQKKIIIDKQISYCTGDINRFMYNPNCKKFHSDKIDYVIDTQKNKLDDYVKNNICGNISNYNQDTDTVYNSKMLDFCSCINEPRQEYKILYTNPENNVVRELSPQCYSGACTSDGYKLKDANVVKCPETVCLQKLSLSNLLEGKNITQNCGTKTTTAPDTSSTTVNTSSSVVDDKIAADAKAIEDQIATQKKIDEANAQTKLEFQKKLDELAKALEESNKKEEENKLIQPTPTVSTITTTSTLNIDQETMLYIFIGLIVFILLIVFVKKIYNLTSNKNLKKEINTVDKVENNKI